MAGSRSPADALPSIGENLAEALRFAEQSGYTLIAALIAEAADALRVEQEKAGQARSG